jgi:phosphonopyruvate decarboxylase
MIEVEKFIGCLKGSSVEFFTGVPDSLLKSFCAYVTDTCGENHVIAANEGGAIGLAAGRYLATGKPALVYMQNSGQGNAVNPLCSLADPDVYSIPMVLLVGWRGEPGVKDEPQHVYQGEVTLKLLEDMDVAHFVIDKSTTEEELLRTLDAWESRFAEGKQAALVVRKGALEFDGKVKYQNENTMLREDILRRLTEAAGDGVIVSTTGKASRELFEIREARGEGHGHDFLTVGSMGHASSIALGIALKKPNRRVWIFDGDGAVLMHMGAMAVIGSNRPGNLVHIVINNESHESVGGQPTVVRNLDLVGIAKACGYQNAVMVSDSVSLDEALKNAKNRNELSFIEAKCAIGARPDLGRPTITAAENKRAFMMQLLE